MLLVREPAFLVLQQNPQLVKCSELAPDSSLNSLSITSRVAIDLQNNAVPSFYFFEQGANVSVASVLPCVGKLHGADSECSRGAGPGRKTRPTRAQA